MIAYSFGIQRIEGEVETGVGIYLFKFVLAFGSGV